MNMIREDAGWGILFGGTRYMVFLPTKNNQVVGITKAQETFAMPPSPSLSAILIALLVSERGEVSHTLSRPVTVKDEPRGSGQPRSLSVRPSQSIGFSPTPNTATSKQHKRKRSETPGSEPCASSETPRGVEELSNEVDVSIV